MTTTIARSVRVEIQVGAERRWVAVDWGAGDSVSVTGCEPAEETIALTCGVPRSLTASGSVSFLDPARAMPNDQAPSWEKFRNRRPGRRRKP